MKTLDKIRKIKFEILVALLFILSRAPSLGHDNFNTDVWRWKARIYDFGGGLFGGQFEKTIQTYHPGVSLMIIGSASIKVYNLYYRVFTGSNPPNNELRTIFELDLVQKFFVVFATGVSISFLFYALRKMFGVKTTFILISVFSLEPFYIALTKVLHLEGLMTTFMVVSFVWFYYYVNFQKGFKSLFVSGFFASLAVLTKSSSLMILPFVLFMLFVEVIFKKTTFKSMVSSYFRWFLIVLLWFVLLWPGMWVKPWEALSTYFTGIFTVGVEGGHDQIYFGSLTSDPGFTFYPVVLMYKTSLYLILGFIGWLFVKANISEDKKKFALYSLFFSFLYFIEISIPSKKLDRYILPSIMGLSLASSFFYDYLLTYLHEKFKKLAYLIFFLIFIPQFILYLKIHPDYFSYYSVLGGGLKRGIFVLEPKWMIGVPEIISYFNNIREQGEYKTFENNETLSKLLYSRRIDDKLTVAFPEKYYTQIWPFIREIKGWAVLESLGPEAERANFFVYPVWEDTSSTKMKYNLKFEGTINIDSVPVYNVYKKER